MGKQRRILGAAILLLACAAQATPGSQSEKIEQLVIATVAAEVAKRYADGTYSITAQPVAAARLKPCDQLVAEIRSQTLHGRVPVHIRCQSPASWALYATATVSVETPVIVAQRAITRGQRIVADDLRSSLIALHRVRPQAITRVEDAIGKIARRPLSANQPISMAHLSIPLAVVKGERVHIQANSGRIRIQSYGVALRSGQVGEQIEVRNESSKRIIQPWILSPGTVGTTPPKIAASP